MTKVDHSRITLGALQRIAFLVKQLPEQGLLLLGRQCEPERVQCLVACVASVIQSLLRNREQTIKAAMLVRVGVAFEHRLTLATDIQQLGSLFERPTAQALN